MRRYGLYGPNSRDFLTYGGRILVHDDKAEAEFLVPRGATIRELPQTIPDDQTVPLLSHPNFLGVTRPITRGQFR